MKHDLDLDPGTRRALIRLIDEIDVDAPLPVDEPATTWGRPVVTAAAGIVLVSAGLIAAGVSTRGSGPAGEITATDLSTDEILWSSGPAADDGTCPPAEAPEASCSSIALVRRDGQLVLTGSSLAGPRTPDPAVVRLRYAVDGGIDEIAIDVVPGDGTGGDVREWSAEVPEEVPELIDEATSGVAVDFFELTALDGEGTVLWIYTAYAGLHEAEVWEGR